jgi:hypothetical protein
VLCWSAINHGMFLQEILQIEGCGVGSVINPLVVSRVPGVYRRALATECAASGSYSQSLTKRRHLQSNEQCDTLAIRLGNTSIFIVYAMQEN